MSASTSEGSRKHRGAKKKRYILPVVILILLVAFRFYLPTLVKNYVNDVLADIPGFYGHVDDIDLALYRGAYVINGMYLNKVNASTEVPFLDFPKTDISIEWKSLFKGKIVSEITMFDPEITYIFEDQQKEAAEGDADTDDWTKALTDLVPININHFEIHNGKLGFVKLQEDPNIDLYLNNLELYADNLRNVKGQSDKLPSPIEASAVSIGKGEFRLDGGLDLIKEIPDMDINFSLQKADITAINDLTQAYGGIDFKEGELDIYGEIAIADAYLKGYVKPMLKDTKLISKEDSFLSVIWEGFVGMFKFILKNQGTDTLATRVPLEGNLDNVNAGVWTTVFKIFENAWFNAFQGKVDQDIDFEDAKQEANLDEMSGKEKRMYRRAKREAEKEKRKKENDDSQQ
ncbi:DUF748 domain-containing protein [Flavimarina sp. Hel_I_48]|uniref:DUF748 domain-containing protein n=1 Tax=Flavimarina sp. Hel_I_48 TaxID=1392488 RepID=UPI0004DF15EB|nr:DUF748 domain-containing protein [Flavimarina sp. Hel_I_48]